MLSVECGLVVLFWQLRNWMLNTYVIYHYVLPDTEHYTGIITLGFS
jgi:hypothetical protein